MLKEINMDEKCIKDAHDAMMEMLGSVEAIHGREAANKVALLVRFFQVSVVLSQTLNQFGFPMPKRLADQIGRDMVELVQYLFPNNPEEMSKFVRAIYDKSEILEKGGDSHTSR
jgi:hypothetical protein